MRTSELEPVTPWFSSKRFKIRAFVLANAHPGISRQLQRSSAAFAAEQVSPRCAVTDSTESLYSHAVGFSVH